MAAHFCGVSPSSSQIHLDKCDSYLGSSKHNTSGDVRNGALSRRAQEGQLDLKRSLRRSDLKDVLHSISQAITVHIGGWNLRKVKEQPIQRLRGMKKVQCG